MESIKVGDQVLTPPGSFTWRERVVIPAGRLSALPSDADPQQLAMLGINPPTAALVLSEYVDLKPGEWVVQNAANSGVGRWVIAFAKTRGLNTVNIVRRPELVAELEAIGGDVVVIDSPDVSERIKAGVGQAELRLALDAVGGPATGVLAATLSPRGTLLSFAAMSETPMSINPLDVIFKPPTMRGFWLGHPEVAAKIAPAIAHSAAMIASGRVHIPVAATYPPLLHQRRCRACATRRKDPSRRRRIIHLTSESSIRYSVGTPWRLEGKIAVITGANSGIALASAKRFVKEGAQVYITRHRQEELDKALQAIGAGVTAVQDDVSAARRRQVVDRRAETAAVNAIASGSQRRTMSAIRNRIARFESASAPECGLAALGAAHGKLHDVVRRGLAPACTVVRPRRHQLAGLFARRTSREATLAAGGLTMRSINAARASKARRFSGKYSYLS